MKTQDILAEKGTRVITVEETVLLVDAVSMMMINQIGCLIVTNNRNEAIGLVSPTDVFRAIHHHPEYLTTITVSEIMTRNIIVVTPEDDVDDLMAIMTESKIRHLPVIERGSLVGLISIGDLVRAKINVWDVEIHYLTDYIEGKTVS
ncbi:MAG: CBS domain-containing protein [Desulfofustis sp.]|jgi:CBS domain-containing protein|nr:CBS domain-containing protein [Desulfofustis sp.]